MSSPLISEESTTDKEWILNKDNLSTVMQCNKLIRDEFGVRLSLVQDDILTQIVSYSHKSTGHSLKKLTAIITNSFPQLKTDDERARDKRRSKYYRGQPVLN